MNPLIIGIDGQIGNALFNIFCSFKRHVYGTTVFSNLVSDNCAFLDLANSISLWHPPKGIDIVYFCAAICSIRECKERSKKTHIINVENTVNLTRKLVDSGAFVVFPSTNMVFDGTKPFYKENDEVSPFNEYGKQKVETENELLKIGNCAIIRFTKIIGNEMQVIKSWINDLKNNIPIHPFSDMKMAPVSLNFAAGIMQKIGESKSAGIWHVSNSEEITYEEVAKHIVRKLNVSENLIKPVKTKEMGISNLPNYTTLDTEKICSAFNIKIPDVFTIINSQFNL